MDDAARERLLGRVNRQGATIGASLPETAETLAEEIVGIDRALHALENIRQPDFGETARTADVEDHKRWSSFLDQLG